MKSTDVAALYDQLPVGALVQIVDKRLPNVAKAKSPILLTTPAPVERTASTVRLVPRYRRQDLPVVCAIQFPHDSVTEMLEQKEWFARDVVAVFARS